MKENYFILLGLNPEINDEEEIVNTINNKQNEWSKGRNHATKGTQYQQYLSYLPEIRRVLLNPKLRAEEANLAKIIKQEQAENKQKVLIDLAKNYIKNNEILEEDLNELLKVAEFKNLSREDTLKILKIKIADNISNFILDDNVQKLEQSTMNIIKEQLKVLNKIDLFDFLGVNNNVGITELNSKANEIYKTVSKNSNKTAEITAKTDLSNLCFKIFKDEASKQIYIKTIDFEKIKELYNEIDASANIEKFIIADRFTAFVLKALNNKVTSIERAEYFIYQYCILKKYNLKFNYKYEYNKPIFCINCKQYNNPKNINCTNCKNSLNATCPKCNNNILNIGLKNCDICGCEIDLFINYRKFVKEAEEHYKNRFFLKAKQLIKNINWPENKLLNELIYKIEDRLTDYYELIIEIENYIKTKNFELATNKITEINKLNLHKQEKSELINKFEFEIIDLKIKSKEDIKEEVTTLLFNNMVFVQGDNFLMGFNNDENNQYFNLSDFYIGKYEVTQYLWEKIMGYNPSDFKGDNLPVENVSWDDCQIFIQKLNKMTGKKFRLPTEAEWEYVARGGESKSRYPYFNQLEYAAERGASKNSYLYSGSNNIDEVAWYNDTNNIKNSTKPVGNKKPNQLGIYDMNGNVWEWCNSNYSVDSDTTLINPNGSSSGSLYVLRGGSWRNLKHQISIYARQICGPSEKSYQIGFRLVMEFDEVYINVSVEKSVKNLKDAEAKLIEAFNEAETSFFNDKMLLVHSFLETSLKLWPQNPKAIKLKYNLEDLTNLINKIEIRIKNHEFNDAISLINSINVLEFDVKYKNLLINKYIPDIENIIAKSNAELEKALNAMKEGDFIEAKNCLKLASNYWSKNNKIKDVIYEYNKLAQEIKEKDVKNAYIMARLIGISSGVLFNFILNYIISSSLIYLVGWFAFPYIFYKLIFGYLHRDAEIKYENNRYD